MSSYDASIDRDANRQVIDGPLPFKAVKRITFAGGTENAIGDHDGTGDPFTIFTVTGDVIATIFGVCKTSLVGSGGTLEVGVAGNTAVIIAQIADVENLDVNEAFIDATPALGEAFATKWNIIAGGLDVIGTVTTANITAGVIDFYCFWRPLSSDGNVVGD